MASQKDDYVHSKFSHTIDPKDGYPISDYTIDRERRVVQFLVLIFSPKKPIQVTVTLGYILFGALSEERAAD